MSISFARRMAGRLMARPLVAALTLAILPALAPAAQAKTPGHTYCFGGVCHQVKSIAETVALVGRDESLSASFYDDCKRDRFNPCGLTSSGEKVRPNDADNAASPVYPDGTVLLIWNKSNGQSAVVRVTNAGPYWGNRKLDVSRATAEKLGFKKKGVAKLAVRVMSAPSRDEARYKKNRRYDAVPGSIGTFASIGDAHARMVVAMADGKVGDRIARADMTASEAADPATGSTPADGLRAAARRTFGLTPAARRVAPSTLTADALYDLIRAKI